MSFVIKSRFFLLSIAFNGLFIQGGLRGINLLVSFGIKLDMFNKVSVNVLTCQLGSVLTLRCCLQGKLFMLLLIAAEFALLKCHIFLSNGRGGGILKLTLQ